MPSPGGGGPVPEIACVQTLFSVGVARAGGGRMN